MGFWPGVQCQPLILKKKKKNSWYAPPPLPPTKIHTYTSHATVASVGTSCLKGKYYSPQLLFLGRGREQHSYWRKSNVTGQSAKNEWLLSADPSKTQGTLQTRTGKNVKSLLVGKSCYKMGFGCDSHWIHDSMAAISGDLFKTAPVNFYHACNHE